MCTQFKPRMEHSSADTVFLQITALTFGLNYLILKTHYLLPLFPLLLNLFLPLLFFFFLFFFVFFHLLLRLLPLALQPTVGFGLSNNVLPFFPYLPPNLSISSLPALEDLVLTSCFHLFLGLPLLLVPPSSRMKIFWASYPPPFSLGGLTSLSFALLSTLLYFLLCSSLLVLDSSDFAIPRFHI